MNYRRVSLLCWHCWCWCWCWCWCCGGGATAAAGAAGVGVGVGAGAGAGAGAGWCCCWWVVLLVVLLVVPSRNKAVKRRDGGYKGESQHKKRIWFHETRPGPANEPHALPFPIPWPMEHKKDRSSIKKGKVRSPRKKCRQQDGRHGDGGRDMEMDGKRPMEHKKRTGAA